MRAILFISLLAMLLRASGLGTRSLGRLMASRNVKSSTSMASTLANVKSDSMSSVVGHSSYNVIENTWIEEYGVKATLYSHKKSGAEVMSIEAADENKVFGITFRTPPNDSTGIPHIMEHSVLCGSRKFPVKEPFVDLLKGSLQNFLNAFTYPDRTCYPVASTNTKDFYNLVHVYLDAVLHPRAVQDSQVLQQEGWHYELEDPNQPLTYKGVVYNEMKGVYSSPDSLLGRETQQSLFPDNTYGVDSGGDPLVIPSLNFEQFKDFHANNYHPSNSRVFFYGNDDPLTRLELLDEYLSGFDKIEVKTQVKFQPKVLKPHRREVRFPLSPGTEPKHMITVNWLLNDEPLDPKEGLALGVLDNLLLGTSSATLRKILIESQLGESITGGGLSDELLQMTFGVGLKGVSPENVNKVEELVLSSMVKIAEEGFPADAVEAAINTIEFRLREFNTGSFPRGLSLMLGMMSKWIYDQNPIDGVTFETALQALKQDLANGQPVFQDLLKKYIVKNEHRVTVEMKPDAQLEGEVAQNEASKLSTIKDSLTPAQIEEIIASTKALKAAQMAEDSPEAKASIPRLSLEDIEPKTRELPIEVVQDGKSRDDGVTILTHSVPSNGILYLDLALDFSGVSDEDLVLLPLFARLLTEAGTTKYDEVTLSRKIGAQTGGVSASYFTEFPHTGVVSDPDSALLYLMVRGKAVREKVDVLFDIVTDVLLNTRLDNQKRAVEILKESKVRRQSSVITSGHTFASSRLAGRYSFLGYFGEMTGGLAAVRESPKLVSLAEKDWPTIQARLERIRDAIVKKGKVVINLTGDDKTLGVGQQAVERIVSALPAPQSAARTLLDEWKANKGAKTSRTGNEGFAVPSQVNYVVKGGSIYQPGEKVSGATSVVSRYLSTGYLWDNVRVVGGAYGGFARFNENTGRFVFMSYRDPNLADTISIYDKAGDALTSAEISEQDLLQAVIGAVGDLDGPLSPDQKGYSSFVEYMIGESAESRQQWRDEVLGTTEGDFRAFAERLKGLATSGATVVFGSQAALEQANAVLDEANKLQVEPAFTDL